MKKLGVLAGVVGSALVILGLIFSIQHYKYVYELFILGTVLYYVFAIGKIVSCIQSNELNINNKISWVFLILLSPLLGAWIYHNLYSRY